MIKELVKLASRLDELGLLKEANIIDSAIGMISGKPEVAITPEKIVQHIDESGEGHVAMAPITNDLSGSFSNSPDNLQKAENARILAERFKRKLYNKKSMVDLNKLLIEIYQTICKLSNISCDSSLTGYPSAYWNANTDKLFKIFCNFAGRIVPSGGWADYAAANGFSPDISGVYDFILLNSENAFNKASKLNIKDNHEKEFIDRTKDITDGMKAPTGVEKRMSPGIGDTFKDNRSDFGAGAAAAPDYSLLSRAKTNKAPFGRD